MTSHFKKLETLIDLYKSDYVKLEKNFWLNIIWIRQTWFYEANKKAEIGKRKYWIYYKKGIVTVKTVKSGIKKAEKNQVW